MCQYYIIPKLLFIIIFAILATCSSWNVFLEISGTVVSVFCRARVTTGCIDDCA